MNSNYPFETACHLNRRWNTTHYFVLGLQRLHQLYIVLPNLVHFSSLLAESPFATVLEKEKLTLYPNWKLIRLQTPELQKPFNLSETAKLLLPESRSVKKESVPDFTVLSLDIMGTGKRVKSDPPKIIEEKVLHHSVM